MLACASGERFAVDAALSEHGCDAPQLADPHRRFVNGIRGLFAGEAMPGPGGLQGLARAFPQAVPRPSAGPLFRRSRGVAARAASLLSAPAERGRMRPCLTAAFRPTLDVAELLGYAAAPRTTIRELM